jgi:glycosyltransferase involved in cell wall biosynthesis
MVSGDRSILQGKRGAFWYTLQELSKHFDRIDLIVPRVSVREASACDFPHVHFHSSNRGLWYQPAWILQTITALVSERPYNVMTIHDYPPFYNGIGGLRAASRFGIPSVLEIHHIVGFPRAASMTEWIGRILSRFLLPFLARRASVVRVVNASVARTLHAWGIPEGRIHIVPSFYLDHALLAGEVPSMKKYDMAFCGRLVANKGLQTLIEVLARVPSASLVVIGDGPERVRFESIARKRGVMNRITMLGWLPSQEDVVGMLRSARILLVPSLSEGGPRVALEAMACGTPVIGNAVGILPDVIDGTNGMIVDGSPDAYVAAVTELLSDEGRRQAMGEQARSVLDRYERTSAIARYASFLASTATSSFTPPRVLFVTQAVDRDDSVLAFVIGVRMA